MGRFLVALRVVLLHIMAYFAFRSTLTLKLMQQLKPAGMDACTADGGR